MATLAKVKLVLEVVLLGAFLFLLIHVARTSGRERVLSLLTNLP